MPRLQFGGTILDVLLDSDGTDLTPLSDEITLWDAQSGGTQVTDIVDADEQEIVDLIVDENGRIPIFLGPDDETTEHLWVEHPSLSTRVAITPLTHSFQLQDEVSWFDAQTDERQMFDDIESEISELEDSNSTFDSNISSFESRLVTTGNNLSDEVDLYKTGEIIFHGYATSDQSIPNSLAQTNVTLHTAVVNKGVWTSGANVTLPAGAYLVYGSVGYTSNTTGTQRNAGVALNGSMPRSGRNRRFVHESGGMVVSTGPVYVESNGTDVLTLVALHNATSSLNTFTGTGYQPSLLVRYVGPV